MARKPRTVTAPVPAGLGEQRLPVARARDHLSSQADSMVLMVGGSGNVELSALRHTSNITAQRVNVTSTENGMANATLTGVEVTPLLEEVVRIRMAPMAAADAAATVLQGLINYKLMTAEEVLAKVNSAIGGKNG